MANTQHSQYLIDNVPAYAILICIDSICHIIGGTSRLHSIWNNESKTIRVIHAFDKSPWNRLYQPYGLVYISKTQTLLAIFDIKIHIYSLVIR